MKTTSIISSLASLGVLLTAIKAIRPSMLTTCSAKPSIGLRDHQSTSIYGVVPVPQERSINKGDEALAQYNSTASTPGCPTCQGNGFCSGVEMMPSVDEGVPLGDRKGVRAWLNKKDDQALSMFPRTTGPWTRLVFVDEYAIIACIDSDGAFVGVVDMREMINNVIANYARDGTLPVAGQWATCVDKDYYDKGDMGSAPLIFQVMKNSQVPE